MLGKRRIDEKIQFSRIGIGFQLFIPTRLVKFDKPITELGKRSVIQLRNVLLQ